MKVFRNLLCAVLLVGASVNVQQAVAQRELGVFNSLAVGAGVGLTGVDVNVATSITPYLALRGGLSIMPNFSLSTDVDVEMSGIGEAEAPDQIEMEGSIKRVSGEVLLSVYPFKKGSFFITAGADFGGSSIVKISGHSDALANLPADAGVIIGDYTIPVDKNGNVSGGLRVNSFRPYVGLGFGRVVPKKRISVMFELGVQFHGKPEVYTNYGDVSQLMAELDADDTFSDIMDKLTFYPVLKLRLCGRIF